MARIFRGLNLCHVRLAKHGEQWQDAEDKLIKDNVPDYLNKWDGYSLVVNSISEETKEVIFAREIEKSIQLQEIYKRYQ